MPRYSVTGPLGPEAIDFHHVIADSPLDALHRLHAEALGSARVSLVDSRLVFANTADQELCAAVSS